MILSDTMKQLIKDTVNQIYDVLELSRGIPIDIDQFVKELDIQLCEDPNLVYEGKIEKCHNGKTIITIKQYHNEEKRRLAIAHELGHYFLHFNDEDKEFKDSVFYRSLEYNNEEIEANQFAFNLLMPEEEYKKFAENNAYNYENKTCDVRKISKHFKVPKQTVVYRGKDLKILKQEER